MHILFLSHYFPPEVNAPASRTYEHCRRWVAAGHQVTVVTCAPNCPSGVVFPGYRNAWRGEEIKDGIRVIRVWTYLAPNQGFVRRICNFLTYMLCATLHALRVSDVDLVVATSPQFFCGWAGVFVSRLRRRPFVLEIRDLWPDSITAVDAMKRSLLIRVLEWMERRLYGLASHIVTVGDCYRDGLLKKGVSESKISVIPNGVDLQGVTPVQDRESIRRRFGFEGKFVCAYIGTVGMAHGLDVMLAAAEKAQAMERNDLLFWIVGDGARREALEADAARRQLTNVKFAGLLAKERIPEAVSAADACLVHLRGVELFGAVLPSKIFEFLALEVPIIMGVRGQAREIVLGAGAGVEMEPDCADSLLHGIEQVRQRSRSSFARRQYVAEHFNRDHLAAKMLQILQSVEQNLLPHGDRQLPKQLPFKESAAQVPQALEREAA